MNGDMKITRIRAQHQAELKLLGDVTLLAQEHNPKLRRTAENRVAFKDMSNSMTVFGKYARVNGFDPTRTFQYVANIDAEIWTLILDMFAKYDPETGEFMDDGLLYRYSAEHGCVRLDKDFFFAILSYFESMGIPCDMRGKVKLN